jgi:TPP-dependent pyruvate/acetoin dehydrogenase alpha subunit
MTAGEGVSARAASLAIPGVRVDGNDVEAVDAAARQYVDEIRAGGGPRLIHAVTYRFKGHVSVDPGTYRDPAEVQAALADDPLLRARQRLLALGASAGDIDAVDAAAKAEIDRALAAAEAAPWPEPAAAYEDIMDTGAGVWR